MEVNTGNQSVKEVAVVTGGNRGIGLEICRQLASNGVTVVLTARDEKRGAEAVSILGTLGLSSVLAHQLNVSDPSSAIRLADFIKEKFGKLDILVNNAAIDGTTSEIGNLKTFQQEVAGMELKERVDRMRKHMTEPYKQAEECLRTNYHGTKAVTKALLPLLQSSSHGRIVNISSRYGLLRFFSGEELKQELNNIDSLSVERLDELVRIVPQGLQGWSAAGASRMACGRRVHFIQSVQGSYERLLQDPCKAAPVVVHQLRASWFCPNRHELPSWRSHSRGGRKGSSHDGAGAQGRQSVGS